jgi:hypothetical protein
MKRLIFVVLIAAIASVNRSARAQTTGAVVGQVTARDTRAPVEGATVMADGPQGESATLSGPDGTFALRGLPVGTYTIRFLSGETLVERPGVVVEANTDVRIDGQVLDAGEMETITVIDPAPAVAVGSSRTETTLNRKFLDQAPLPFQMGGVLDKAPGAFFDPVGVSVYGATGAENLYLIDGVNATSIAFGTLGSDLPTPFIQELEILTGGYNAEYGGAVGGVFNVVTRSGSNKWRGSALGLFGPAFTEGAPRRTLSLGTVLSSTTTRRHESHGAFEVGGPLVRDRLFLWAGYAPSVTSTYTTRHVDRFVDADGDGMADVSADGGFVRELLSRTRVPTSVDRHQYGGKLTWVPLTNHRLDVALYGTLDDETSLQSPNKDLRAAQATEARGRHDVSARWLSNLFDGFWRIEANLGLHTESARRRPVFADTAAFNEVIFLGAPPSLTAFDSDPALAAPCAPDPVTGFLPCPVEGYAAGGFGYLNDVSAWRLNGQLKSTNTFYLGGRHELKYGGDYELNRYSNERSFTGPPGGHAQAAVFDGAGASRTLYRLPFGTRAYRFLDQADGDSDPNDDGSPSQLAGAPFYQDGLKSETETRNVAAFAQDSWHPRPNVTVNVGARWSMQSLDDYRGQHVTTIGNGISPRLGAVWDPTNEGRSRVFGHLGRFFQTVPMQLNNRGFGGEGILTTFYPGDFCAQDPGTWTRGDPARSWRTCDLTGIPEHDVYFPFGGENLLVQRKLKGSVMDEIVLGGEYEVARDLVLGVHFTNRRMGRVVEDADRGAVLANPGDVPASTIADQERAATEAEARAAVSNSTEDQAAANEARFFAESLKNAAAFPRPERTTNALTLTMRQRFVRRWLAQASYTFSRTTGNFTGPYAADYDQLDPGFTGQYDYVEMMLNGDGPLPTDRPHNFRADGAYELPVGRGVLTSGLGFMAMSGRLASYLGSHPVQGPNHIFILPRGTAGRSPLLTRVDLRMGFRMPLPGATSLEAFVEIFNVLNQRTATRLDEAYTLDNVDPIVGGDEQDLALLKDLDGGPVRKNPNFLQPIAYQAPIAGRMGLRFVF